VGKDAERYGPVRSARLRLLGRPTRRSSHSTRYRPTSIRRGNAGQQVAVDITLHGHARRLEVVTAGGHLQVFHCRSLLPRSGFSGFSGVVPAWCAIAHGGGPITTDAACTEGNYQHRPIEKATAYGSLLSRDDVDRVFKLPIKTGVSSARVYPRRRNLHPRIPVQHRCRFLCCARHRGVVADEILRDRAVDQQGELRRQCFGLGDADCTSKVAKPTGGRLSLMRLPICGPTVFAAEFGNRIAKGQPRKSLAEKAAPANRRCREFCSTGDLSEARGATSAAR